MLEPLLRGVLRQAKLTADDAGSDVTIVLEILLDFCQQLFLGVGSGLASVSGTHEMGLTLNLL